MVLATDRTKLQKVQLLVLDKDYTAAHALLLTLLDDPASAPDHAALRPIAEALAGGQYETARDALAALLFEPVRTQMHRRRQMVIALGLGALAVLVGALALHRPIRDLLTPNPLTFDEAAKTLHIEPVSAWKRYTLGGGRFSVALPARLRVEDVYGDDVEAAASNVQDTYFVASDTMTENRGGWPITLMFAAEAATPGESLDDAAARWQWEGFEMVETATLHVNGLEIRRVRARMTLIDEKPESALYVFQHDDLVWVIFGTASGDDFRAWLPIFDAIAGTVQF